MLVLNLEKIAGGQQMNIFILVMIIVSGCSFIFDLFFSLYLAFNNNISQEKYANYKRDINTLLLIIPAMNEYQALKRNMQNLIDMHDQCKDFINLKLVFVDDDSCDGTTNLLREYLHNDNIYVFHRIKPNAQIGKGPALQDAVDRITRMNYSLDSTILGIIDADSLFDKTYLQKVVEAFKNSNYDLVQTRVDIFNTNNNLTLMQNFELSIYNGLLQMARTNWGSALASGNGQFVTLKMAEDVGWSKSLLEDCEFSLKGLLKGYRGTFLNTTGIKQEGVITLKRLIRQRTRWCQGGLQCLKIYGRKIINSTQLPTVIKTFVILFLLVPYFSIIIAPASIVSLIVLILYAKRNFVVSVMVIIILAIIDYVSNGLMIWKQWREANFETKLSFLKMLRIIFSFSIYRWILAFIPYRSIAREIVGKNSWVKTSHF